MERRAVWASCRGSWRVARSACTSSRSLVSRALAIHLERDTFRQG